KARELIYSEKCSIVGCCAWVVFIEPVREQRIRQPVWPAVLAQNASADLGMFLDSRVLLVVEIVKQAQHPPRFHRLAQLFSVGAHSCLNRQAVLAQALALNPLRQEFPSIVSGFTV